MNSYYFYINNNMSLEEIIVVFVECPYDHLIIKIVKASMGEETIPNIPYCEELVRWLVNFNGIKRFLGNAIKSGIQLNKSESTDLQIDGIYGSVCHCCDYNVSLLKKGEFASEMIFTTCDVYVGKECVYPFDIQEISNCSSDSDSESENEP